MSETNQASIRAVYYEDKTVKEHSADEVVTVYAVCKRLDRSYPVMREVILEEIEALDPVRHREHEVRDVGRSVHGEAGMVILDSDPCRADSVRVTLFAPHLPDRIDYLVETVDEVADAAIHGCVGVDAVELLGLREQFSHIAVRVKFFGVRAA